MNLVPAHARLHLYTTTTIIAVNVFVLSSITKLHIAAYVFHHLDIIIQVELACVYLLSFTTKLQTHANASQHTHSTRQQTQTHACVIPQVIISVKLNNAGVLNHFTITTVPGVASITVQA